jgi:quercetin dioxygenase-like cupin family protein
VLDGTLTFKVGDDVFEARPGSAVRVAPEAVRSVHNDTDADVILVITSVKATDYDGEVETQDNFWPN